MVAKNCRTGIAGRVIVLDVVGLQSAHLASGRAQNLARLLDNGLTGQLRPPFPAVTVPVQTTLASGTPPARHGDVANGEYDRDQDEVAFWERDRGPRTRLWETARDEAGLTTGVLFFQHLIGTTADVAVTPSPIEDEDNNFIEMDCWTNPDGFYETLREDHGHFPLHNYWGPSASEASSQWILTAASETIERYDPDLLWIYVPHLDYAGQKFGPNTKEMADAVETVDALVGEFLDRLRKTPRWSDTVVNVLSEYGFHEVDSPIFPNRVLREAGLLTVQDDGAGGEEIDLPGSEAFAMVDHQIAHVYANKDTIERTREACSSLENVELILSGEQKSEYGIDHPNAGELVLVAEPDGWFQYYWWFDRDEAPYYASEMDIHAKPGFDPCELFFGDDGLVTLDPTAVRGSHGRVDEGTLGFYGLGGPAAPSGTLECVDAVNVSPTIADLLGIANSTSAMRDMSGRSSVDCWK